MIVSPADARQPDRGRHGFAKQAEGVEIKKAKNRILRRSARRRPVLSRYF
jgi:hypothetical protein